LPSLSSWIESAAEFGFIAGDLNQQLEHSECFARVVGKYSPTPLRLLVDLGSGGGIPAISIIGRVPETPVLLVESMRRRANFLVSQLVDFGWSDRVVVCQQRAEVVARAARWREAAGVVTARSFGKAAVTAEIAAGFLAVGGVLVVSDPPHGSYQERWPDRGLEALGFARVATITIPYHFTVLTKVESKPHFPRGVGVPAKVPLF